MVAKSQPKRKLLHGSNSSRRPLCLLRCLPVWDILNPGVSQCFPWPLPTAHCTLSLRGHFLKLKNPATVDKGHRVMRTGLHSQSSLGEPRARAGEAGPRGAERTRSRRQPREKRPLPEACLAPSPPCPSDFRPSSVHAPGRAPGPPGNLVPARLSCTHVPVRHQE